MDFTQRIFQKIKQHQHFCRIAIIVLCGALAYANCLQNEFVWDDEFLIQKNRFITDWSHLPDLLTSNSTAGMGNKDNFYRPTQGLLYLILYSVNGLDPMVFHIGNILLHIINALLIYLLLFRLGFNWGTFFTTALLWVVHPVHTEAITYISGSADPLSFMFALGSLILFPFKDRLISIPTLLLSLLLFALALVSKESLVMLPALLTITLFCIHTTKRMPAKLLWTTPYWLVTVVYFIARKTVLNFDQTFSMYKTTNVYTENVLYRIYTYAATLPEYVEMFFLPTNLHMERHFPVFVDGTAIPVLIGLAITLATLIACLFDKKKQYLFCWLWFFTAFIPMMGILIPVNSFVLEHWLYIPSLGVFLAISLLLEKFKKTKAMPAVVLTVLVITSITLTLNRNRDWENPISFYSNILHYNDGTARVHNNIAMAYSSEKNFPKAIEHYKTAISISDTYPQTHYNLARVYIQQQNYTPAQTHLNRSLELNPNFPQAINLKEELLLHLRKFQKQ